MVSSTTTPPSTVANIQSGLPIAIELVHLGVAKLITMSNRFADGFSAHRLQFNLHAERRSGRKFGHCSVTAFQQGWLAVAVEIDDRIEVPAKRHPIPIPGAHKPKTGITVCANILKIDNGPSVRTNQKVEKSIPRSYLPEGWKTGCPAVGQLACSLR